jgi:ferredoxin-NADP reductase
MEQVCYTTVLQRKIMIAKDVLELEFEKPTTFTFKAGQFVQFFIPDGMQYVLRSYSIASPPGEEGLEFCVKLLPTGKGSDFFREVAKGTPARFQGPNGKFIIENYLDESILFIATGVGLSPMMSMLKDCLTKTRKKIQLFFGVRSQQDIFWLERLNELKNRFAHFDFTLTLSQPEGEWNGVVGRVTPLVSLLDAEFEQYYVCGSLQMVKDVRTLLLAKHIESQRIHIEIF